MSLIHQPKRPGTRWMTLSMVAVFGLGLAVGYGLGRTKGVVTGNDGMTGSTTTLPVVPPAVATTAAPRRSGGSGVENVSNVEAISITGDLRNAYRAVVKIYDARARQKALQQLVEMLPVERWSELFDAIQKINKAQEFQAFPEETARHIGLTEELLALMAATSPEAGLLALRQHGGPDTSAAFDGIVRHWASQDLQATLAFYEKYRISDQIALSIEAAGAIAREYVKRDPNKTFEWIETLSAEHRPEATRVAFQILSRTDTDAALEFFSRQTDLTNRGSIANHIAAGWAEREPEAALAWANGLPPEISTEAVEGAILVWTRVDWQAASLAVRDLEPSSQAAALVPLGEVMTPDRLEPMADILMHQPHSANQEALLKHLASSYQLFKPEEGSAWLAELPHGQMRDIAIQGFINDLDKSDPEGAAAWASAITDIQSRNSSLHDKVGKWLAKDHSAARQWIQSTERLNEADRARFLSIVGD